MAYDFSWTKKLLFTEPRVQPVLLQNCDLNAHSVALVLTENHATSALCIHHQMAKYTSSLDIHQSRELLKQEDVRYLGILNCAIAGWTVRRHSKP